MTFDQNLVSSDTAGRAPLLAENDHTARELWSSTSIDVEHSKWNISIHKAGEQFKEDGAQNIYSSLNQLWIL